MPCLEGWRLSRLIAKRRSQDVLDRGVQLRLVVFHRQDLVTFWYDDLLGGFLLATQRVDRDDSTFHVDPLD